MRRTELVGKLKGTSAGMSLAQEFFDGHEQRLSQWGCSKCQFFEKKVFGSGLRPEELDAYIICRFAGDIVDLIGEATACPKTNEESYKKRKNLFGLSRNIVGRQLEVRSSKRRRFTPRKDNNQPTNPARSN